MEVRTWSLRKQVMICVAHEVRRRRQMRDGHTVLRILCQRGGSRSY